MDIGAIDRSATRGDGPLRCASPVVKLAALALMLAAVLTTWNVFVLAAVLLSIAAGAVWGRVPLRHAVVLAAYPAAFALVFALASAPDAWVGAAIVGKAVCAAAAAVVVVLTTPYPQIFAPLQRVLPGVAGDALLMTYRTTFLMLEKFGRLMRAIRLRSGSGHQASARRVRLTASALGGLLLYAIDLAQRDYDVMHVRGYSGRLRISRQRSTDRAADVAIIAAALSLLAIAVLWRLAAPSLNPYSWIAPVPSLLALAVTTARKDG